MTEQEIDVEKYKKIILNEDLDKTELAHEPKSALVENKELELEPVNSEKELISVQKDRNLYKQCVLICKTEAVPQCYRNKPELTYSALKLLEGLGAKGIQFLQKVAPINGNLAIWGEFPLTLVRNSGKLVFFDEYLINKDYKRISLENHNLADEIFASVCVVQRVGETKRTFTYLLEDAKKIPNFTRMSNIWKPYLKAMLKYKARALALKDVFSDILMGIRISEYDDHQTLDHKITIEKQKPKEITFDKKEA